MIISNITVGEGLDITATDQYGVSVSHSGSLMWDDTTKRFIITNGSLATAFYPRIVTISLSHETKDLLEWAKEQKMLQDAFLSVVKDNINHEAVKEQLNQLRMVLALLKT